MCLFDKFLVIRPKNRRFKKKPISVPLQFFFLSVTVRFEGGGGISSGDARNNDGARHSDIMIQVYRLLEYSHLVTDLPQSKHQSDTTVGGVSKRQKVYDLTTAATGGAVMDCNQLL